MGATYTRQSSYTDGDTITAAHTNDEFDQLLAAFQASSGHTHDGTANEGGPITKLLGNTLTFGAGTAGTDITVTFDGESNDGVLYWMEDEDYFKFSDDILINSTEKLYFQDTGTYIYSNADGDLDLVSDGTNADAIKLASSGGITLDAAGDIILDADGDDITLKNGSATYGSFTNSSGELVIKSGSTPTTAMTFSGANVTFSGTVTIGSAGISEAELEILDGATVTTTELNIMDGDTTASSTTVADADRVVFNDDGTMKQVAVTDLAAYFDDEITAMPNLTSVGTLTTLTVDNVIINGTTIGHTSDTDLMTVASGVLTVAGEVDATSLDISGDADIDGTTNLDAVDIDGAVQIDGATTFGVDDTGVDVKFFGATSGAYLLWDESADKLLTAGGAVVDIVKDKLLIGGTAVTTTAAELNVLDAVTAGTVTASLGVVVDSNKDIGTFRNITLSGELDAGSLDVSGDVDVDGTTNLDNTDIDGTLAVDGSSISLDSTSTLNIDNSNTSNGITIGTATSGVPISIGHTTSEVTVNDNLTVTGDLTVSGTTTTVNSTTVNLNDHNIVLDSGNSTSAVINGAGITIEGGSGDDATFSYNTTGPKFELKLGSSHEDLQVDQLIAASLDISGNIDVDGTTNLDAVDVDGTVQIDGATTFGVDDTGVDVKFFGATSGAYLLWDESADKLLTAGGAVVDIVKDKLLIGGTAVTTTAAELNVLDAVTGGTVTANLAVVVDSNKDIGSFRNITLTGELDAGSLDVSGDADIDGTLEADAITVNGSTLSSVIQDEATALAIALG